MKKEKKDSERRLFLRREYKPNERPTLKIGKFDFEVIDISKRGLRFINKNKINLEGWISGTLTFLDNRSIEIDGIIVRKQNNEIGLHLVGPISV